MPCKIKQYLSRNRKIAYLKDSLPDCVSKIHGNGRSDLEDLAFLSRQTRETDEIGRRVCLRKLRPVDCENTPLLPQRVKSGSIPGFALLSIWSRNHARSAFHTVFSTHCPSLMP
jgi:hypothetical protein